VVNLIYLTLALCWCNFSKKYTNMKKHFISLFNTTHRKRTIYLFIVAALFIIISLLVGISDNLPMIAMLLTGIIFLFLAVLHPWRKTGNYGILIGVCVGILLLEFLGITEEYDEIIDRIARMEAKLDELLKTKE